MIGISMRLVTAMFILGILPGCVQYDNKRGVETVWQPDAVKHLVKGQSTRQDVLKLLGPPSQVIALDDETVLYYLFEYSRGEGLILIVAYRHGCGTARGRCGV